MSGKESGYVFTKLVTVRGDSRSSGTSATDFTYNLGTNVQRVARVSIPSVLFRNNAYNINSDGPGANNTFSFVDGFTGTEFDLSVNAGWYSITDLMSAVQSAIQSALDGLGNGQTIAINQDPISNKVRIGYNQGAATDDLGAGDVDGKVGIWEVLGFEIPFYIRNGEIEIAPNLPSLGGLTEVYLHSNELAPGNMFDKDGTQKNALLAIPVTSAFGVLNLFECKVDSLCEISYPTPRNLQVIDFSLRDWLTLP